MNDDDNEIGIVLLGQKLAVEGAIGRADDLLREKSVYEPLDADVLALLATFADDEVEISEDEVRDLLVSTGYDGELSIQQSSAHVAVSGSFEWSDVVSRYRDSLTSSGVEIEKLGIDSTMSEADRIQFEKEWDFLILKIDESQKQRQIDNLISSIKTSILASVIRPFGLGALMKHRDRVGGPVTNAKNLQDAGKGGKLEGVSANEFANPEAVERQRTIYEPQNYRNQSAAYRESKQRLQASGEADRDAYSGKSLDPSFRDLDHVVSAKETHYDPKLNLHFSHEEKVGIANAPENLVYTDSGVNRSKAEHSMEDFIERKRGSGKFNVDPEKARAVDQNVRDKRSASIAPREQEYYLKEVTKAAAAGAITLGLREALGLLLAELIVALFEEAQDIFRSGVTHGTAAAEVLPALHQRLKRVSDRVVARKDAAWTAFKDGALAGAVSAVVTVAINTVITTSKRIVRIIREGLLSLLRAVKMLVFPPPEMSPERAAHEASKIVAAAVIVGVGIAAQEPMSKAILAIPVLVPFADLLIEVLMGIVVGIISGIVVYGLDQLDLFGAMETAKEDEKTSTLLASVDRDLDELAMRLEELSVKLAR